MGRGLWAWLGMGGSVGIKKTDMWAVRRPQASTAASMARRVAGNAEGEWGGVI